MSTIKRLLLGVSFGLFAAAVHAAPVTYSSIFEGTTFRISTIDGSSNSLQLQILGVASSTGSWASAVAFDNFALKGIGSGITGGSVTPGTWATSTLELNASGCTGGASGGVCFDANPSVLLTDDMNFRIDLTFASGYALNIGAAGPHLKVRFVDGGGRKVGSLLSATIGQSTLLCDAGGDCDRDAPRNVPEPMTLGLVGVALLAGGFVRRRTVAARR